MEQSRALRQCLAEVSDPVVSRSSLWESVTAPILLFPRPACILIRDDSMRIGVWCIFMEHFDIVLALSRIALDADGPRATQQIERLRDALRDSAPDQAAKLSRLLSRAKRRHEIAPMAMDEMRATAEAARRHLPGEPLSPSTPPPTDRETGTPLARVTFPGNASLAPPILTSTLATAIEDLLAEWKRSEDLARIGSRPHMRCLIYGAPGVGKTNLAHYLSVQLGLPCVEVRLDGVVSSFLGTTARNIGALFDFANRYRCLLFLDEFDAVAKARDDAQEIGEIKRVVNTLLQSLDARNGHGVTIAATNHEHLLDPAVWRRFDSRIHIPKPDAAARESLLARFLSPIRVTPPEMHLLIWATAGMSGADIEILVEAAKRFLVLHGPGGTADGIQALGPLLLSVLRSQATINRTLFDDERAGALTGSIEDLDRALQKDGFTQAERGAFEGVSQSAVSRRDKKTDANVAKAVTQDA